jgi:hypothetical protein
MGKQSRVFISSTHADRYPEGKSRTDSIELDFQENIACSGDEALYIFLENIAIPIARNNVHASINTLQFDGGFGAFNIEMPVGQYKNAEAFRLALQTAFNSATRAITATYTELTNKITLRNTMTQSVFVKGSSPLAQLIGLNLGEDLTLPVGTDVIFPRQLDLSGCRAIQVILENFDLQSTDSANGNSISTNVLASIPISVGYGDIQTYQAKIYKPILSNRKNLSSLNILLTDENGNPYDLGGLEYTMLIIFTIKKPTEVF